MKLVDIPSEVKKQAMKMEKLIKKQGHTAWYDIPANMIPKQGIEAIALSTGLIKEGTKVYLIGGHDRAVFIGKNLDKFHLHEYVALLESGTQRLVQLGRDVKMS